MSVTSKNIPPEAGAKPYKILVITANGVQASATGTI
jgi:hypothetical protein